MEERKRVNNIIITSKIKVLFKQSLKEEWAHDSHPDFRVRRD